MNDILKSHPRYTFIKCELEDLSLVRRSAPYDVASPQEVIDFANNKGMTCKKESPINEAVRVYLLIN